MSSHWMRRHGRSCIVLSIRLAKQVYNLATEKGPLPNTCTRVGFRGASSRSVPRWRMSPLIGLLVVWGVLTAILIILLIYRGTLTMHEDDQLFLNESDTHMEQEQAEVLSKVNKIGPYVKVLGAVSGVLILVIAGIYLYQGLSNTLPQ